MSDYILIKRMPTIKEFLSLREAVGWGHINLDKKSIELALKNSLFGVCVDLQGEIIGFGRVIGDGGVYFYIQDIIVHPDHQRKGIGSKIMSGIMEYLSANVLKNAFVGLMAAPGVSEFYTKYGFEVRSLEGPGMGLLWK